MDKNRKKGQNPGKILPIWMILLDKKGPDTPIAYGFNYSLLSTLYTWSLKKWIISVLAIISNLKWRTLTANQHFEGNK